MPIVGAMDRELLSGGYIQADETPVDVQSERSQKGVEVKMQDQARRLRDKFTETCVKLGYSARFATQLLDRRVDFAVSTALPACPSILSG
jgi:hypothetical protein